ncbi:MAG TPA: pyridoxal-phosphate dependent enzyme [Pseudonocardiaceae bacterium]|nr:pyridoxal-phosphate dependent enzyme [Pseudonocardiaceae bacterium]
MNIPLSWYSIAADPRFELPRDLRQRVGPPQSLPPGLARQELAREPWLPIPREVRERYAMWRPTPLRRATNLERSLRTRARLYYKYEGGNLAGGHELNTAVAQAYYHRIAGTGALTATTHTGRWGTAAAVACHMFGLPCHIHLEQADSAAQAQHRMLMELLGASVTSADAGPEPITTGKPTLYEGEPVSVPHHSVIGLEAFEQMRHHGAMPGVVVAGRDFAGTAGPFLYEAAERNLPIRCVSAEAAPTRSGLVNTLRRRKLVEVVTYPQDEVFASLKLFTRSEGILPTLDSAFAVHGALVEAVRADQQGRAPTILFSLSSHGLFDLPAYRSYLDADDPRTPWEGETHGHPHTLGQMS